jgi:hypothetical protein
MQPHVSAILVLSTLAAAACASDDELLGVPDGVRDATVLIHATATGSGVLVKQDGAVSYVATNAHVVCDTIGARPSAKVTFYCGTPKDKELDGLVVAVDQLRDLAIIRVESAELPKPLLLGDPARLAARAAAFAAGFPLPNDRRPQATIVRCNVGGTTIMPVDPFHVADFTVFRGSVFPGNSGGPVVDEAGKLLGICTRAFSEDKYFLAVSSAGVAMLLTQRMDAAVITEVENAQGTLRLNITVPLEGFGGAVTSCTVIADPLALVNPGTGTRITDKREGTFRWPLPTQQVLAAKKGSATGEMRLSGDGRTDAEFLFCVKIKLAKDAERFAGYFRGTVKFSKPGP